MTLDMQLRWVWTIIAAIFLVVSVISSDPVYRAICVWMGTIQIVKATLSWKAFNDWKTQWDIEQRKGMPE